jgi:hypothetical protein
MASALRRLPKERIKWMRELWAHPHKKRVRLQRVGGANSGGRGYVIDDHTIVDGITRRMDDLKCDESVAIATEIADFYKRDATYIQSKKNAMQMDKSKGACHCLKRGHNPMKHGSKVHNQVYHAVRYAVHISGAHRTKRPLPKKFSIDPCANSCLIGMVKSGLFPFSSEWPMFTTTGTGIATSVDILALDSRNSYEPVFVEIKTGSVTKAMDTCISKSWQTIGKNGFVSAAAQVVLTKKIAVQCYSRLFSDGNSSACVIFARPWGIVRIEIPDGAIPASRVADLLQIMLDRKNTLRSKLSTNANTQAHMTTSNTPRKRPPKVYEAGFEAKADE